MIKKDKREKKNILELIEEMCPDGVEWKRLGDVANVRRGKRVIRKQLSQEEGYPVYQNSLTAMGYYTDTNYPAGTAFVISAGNAGAVGYSTVDFWAADDCLPVVGNEYILNRFIYHVLMWKKDVLIFNVRKAAVPRLSRNAIISILIPVPPLAVQREVVRVLDTFTELTAELTTALKAEDRARKRQYAYYRDEMLRLDGVEGVEWKRLGDVTVQRRGKGLKKDDKGSGNTAIILYGELYTTYGDYITDIASRCDGEVATGALPVSYGDILLPISSTTRKAQIGKASVLKVSEPVYIGGDAVALTPKDCILSDYLMYCLNGMAFEEQKMKCVKGTTIQHLNPSMMYDIEIPIPPLSIQQDIIQKLDAFSSYCNDLTSGLPAEIEARRKQYAYYRDRLLSFPPVQ